MIETVIGEQVEQWTMCKHCLNLIQAFKMLQSKKSTMSFRIMQTKAHKITWWHSRSPSVHRRPNLACSSSFPSQWLIGQDVRMARDKDGQNSPFYFWRTGTLANEDVQFRPEAVPLEVMSGSRHGEIAFLFTTMIGTVDGSWKD